MLQAKDLNIGHYVVTLQKSYIKDETRILTLKKRIIKKITHKVKKLLVKHRETLDLNLKTRFKINKYKNHRSYDTLSISSKFDYLKDFIINQRT